MNNLKPRALKAAVVNGLDKVVYAHNLEVKQVAIDFANFSVAEMFTNKIVSGAVGPLLSSLSPEMRDQAVELLIVVGQDMLLQRVIASRPRGLVPSIVSFGAAELSEPVIGKAIGIN